MNDDYGIWPVFLEYRQRGRTLTGEFPYGKTATISDRGRVRKEHFTPGAFSFSVQDPTRDINLLAGHSFDRPLASKLGGTLKVEDTPKALTFRATLPAENDQPSWMRDAVLSIRGGLVGGISPGFSVPPASIVPDAEELIDEPGNPGVSIRTISAAILFELSLVTRPAYKETVVDLRAEDFNVCEIHSATPSLDKFEAYRWL